MVTSRGDVHWVVTESGVAYLHGRSLRQRAEALIQIAHPDFRDDLTDAARELGYLERKTVATYQPAPLASQACLFDASDFRATY